MKTIAIRTLPKITGHWCEASRKPSNYNEIEVHYTDNEWILYFYDPDSSPSWPGILAQISFCPFCGKKLSEIKG